MSSTGALERNLGKSTITGQKQQSRTASKSRSGTPNFGFDFPEFICWKLMWDGVGKFIPSLGFVLVY